MTGYPPSSTEHDALLRAAAGGDDEALAELVRTYHDRVHRFATRVCRDPFDADDAVQEAFLALAVRPEVQRDGRVLSWLITVAKNACLRLLRPLARARVRLGDLAEDGADLASQEPTPEVALERGQLALSVHAAIAELGREYREVLVLRDLEGLTGDEVCRALGLSRAAMKSRLHRARVAVRWHLRAAGFGVPHKNVDDDEER